MFFKSNSLVPTSVDYTPPRMPELSLCATDSKASRKIVFSVPTTAYAFDENKVNITLQFLFENIVEDLKALSTNGVPSREHGATWLLCVALYYVYVFCLDPIYTSIPHILEA